jgi:hypothetical protein
MGPGQPGRGTGFQQEGDRLCSVKSNGLSAFDFAQKMVQAKDLGELIQIQRMFFEWQIQALSEQVKELGETAATSAIGNVRDIREISEAA